MFALYNTCTVAHKLCVFFSHHLFLQFFSLSAATFISFLLEVDSVYEVHDYIKSYLGETKDAHDFAKQFLDKRQKVKPLSQPQQHSQVGGYV